MQQTKTLDFSDNRSFSLIDYRHSHSNAVFRGFPEIDDDTPGGAPVPVLDLYFTNVKRIASWKDLGSAHFREADPNERAVLEASIGPISGRSSVFLLERDSLDNYVIAGRCFWAEFMLPYGATSPLASDDPEFRARHLRPDTVVYATRPRW